MAHFSFQEATDLVYNCFVANGCSGPNALQTARVVALAEADGCASHGLFRVPGYIRSLRSGKVSGSAVPQVSLKAPSVIQVNGDGGFAPPAHHAARSLVVDTAKSEGIAVVGFVNIYHFSALWADIEPICAENLCAFAFTSYLPAVAPAGGTKALFGTNPMAFGWPRTHALPMIFDQASSVVARGEVMLAARDGHTMAEGVGIDAQGHPTTDPKEILGGAMLPFGGYKGSAIALMVELLAGPLIGEVLSFEAAAIDNADGGPPRGGELLLVLSPDRIGGADWSTQSEKLFGKISEQPGARLPADRRYSNRQRSMQLGMNIPDSVVDKIKDLM